MHWLMTYPGTWDHGSLPNNAITIVTAGFDMASRHRSDYPDQDHQGTAEGKRNA